MDLDAVNLVDLAAVCLVVAGLVGGIRSGALPQLGGLAGAIGGAVLVLALAPLLRERIVELELPVRALAVLGGLLVAVGIGETIGSATGRTLGAALGDGLLGIADRVLGAYVGLAQAILVIWLVGGLLAIGPSTLAAGQAQRSTAVRVTASALPPIGEVATRVGGMIDASGLPRVFVGLEPLPAPPVGTPGTAEAGRIAAAALASTVAVESVACVFTLTGTGFVVEPGYVVTNAHVVAGATSTRVSIDGRSAEATVVLFDPELDVALLHAPGLDAPALALATGTPARGLVGAALGHPGGGGLTVIPGAVTGSYEAEGRDLYGERRVLRRIVELRAAIDQGDSGGPFVLADGTVGAVVFAEARSDDAVGYGLDPLEVAAAIAPGLGTSEAASTGPCLR